MALIVLDAGHGGANPGAVYQGRQEKDDALALVLAVGEILENSGVDVYYTRTTDIYESPYQKAQEANAAGADYFVSIHRNSSPYPNQYTGVESLVYSRYGAAAVLAANINYQLEMVGFVNQGVNERPNLVVLNSTQMPAVLVEVGFLSNDEERLKLQSKLYQDDVLDLTTDIDVLEQMLKRDGLTESDLDRAAAQAREAARIDAEAMRIARERTQVNQSTTYSTSGPHAAAHKKQ